MDVRVQVMDEKGLPVFCTVAAVRSSDQVIVGTFDTDSTGVALITGIAGTFYPRPMVSTDYKHQLKMVILNDQNGPCYDYVVDAGGGGTHLTVTAALTAAAAQATSSHISIFICGGDYAENPSIDGPSLGTIDITGAGKRRVNITGQVSNSTTLTHNSVTCAVTLRGLTVTSHNSATARALGSGQSANALWAEDCLFTTGTNGIAIQPPNSGGWTFTHCTIAGKVGVADASGGASDVIWTDVRLVQCDIVATTGVVLNNDARIMATGCLFTSTVAFQTGGATFRSFYIECVNCDFTGATGAVQCSGAGNFYSSRWIGCRFQDQAIAFDWGTTANSADDITIEGCYFSTNTGTKKAIDDTSGALQNSVIVGNVFAGYNANNEIIGVDTTDNQIAHNTTDSGATLPDTHTGSGGGAPASVAAKYVTYASDATLTANRVATAGEGISLTDAGTDDGALTWAAYLAQLQAPTDLTIAAGVITITGRNHRVDTEAAAASDDLDTISGTAANRVLVIHPVNDARTIVIKHNTGNIKCVGNADITLDDAHDYAILFYDGTLAKWSAQMGGTGSGGASGHAIHEETAAALTTRADLHFMGAGIFAQDNGASTRTEVIVGAYFEAIVDNNDTNAKGKGNVYSTIQAAITAGAKTIFVRGTTADAVDITIAIGDSVTRIVGENSQTAVVPVNIVCNKADVLFESLKFYDPAAVVGKTLTLAGARDVAFACFFTGAVTPPTALVNAADGTGQVPLATLAATPIKINIVGHGYVSNDGVVVAGQTGCTNANGTWTVTKIDNDNFTLNGSVNNGAITATGTVTKQGVAAAGTTLAYDTAVNLPTAGFIKIGDEVLNYTGGGGAASGTLTGVQRGVLDTRGVPHGDNSTITGLYGAHCIVSGADVQLVQNRFIGCSNTFTSALLLMSNAVRARVVSNVFLGNSTYFVIGMAMEANATPLQGVQVVGGTIDSNTPFDAQIGVFPKEGQSNTTSSQGVTRAIAITGNLIRDFDGPAIIVRGDGWNIAGNVLDGEPAQASSCNTLAALVNKVGTIGSGDTTIPYDTQTGNGTFAPKGVILIDSEYIAYGSFDGTNFYNCLRGFNRSTAATHADNATITNYSQMAVWNRFGTLSARTLVSGNVIQKTTSYYSAFDPPGIGVNHSGALLATNLLLYGSRFFGSQNHVLQANVQTGISGLTFDFQSFAGQSWTGGLTTGGAVANLATDTVIDVVSISTALTGIAASTVYVPDSNISANLSKGYGRVAGDQVNIAIPLLNKTGANSVATHVVIVNAALANSFKESVVLGGADPLVVGVCVQGGIADGSPALVAVAGVVSVLCTGAVNIGDNLVTDVAAGVAKAAAAPAVSTRFAKALTAGAFGAGTGTITAVLMPG